MRARCDKWVAKCTGDDMKVGVAPCSVLIESRTCLCSDSAGVVRMRAPGCVIITSSAAGHSGVCVRVCVCDLLSCCYCCWITERGCEETRAGEESTRTEAERSGPPGARPGTVSVSGVEAHRSGSLWRTDKEVEQTRWFGQVLKKNAAFGSVLPLFPALQRVTGSPVTVCGCWFYR